VPIFCSALLLAALSAQPAPAQASEPGAWPLADLHQASTALDRFPPAERSIAASLLKPYLGPLFQGESSGERNQAMRSFRAEKLTWPGGAALAVQPSGSELCGGTGNCSFWIVDLHRRRVILNTVGIQSYTVRPARHDSMPEIVTSSHASTFESERVLWHFQSSGYERESCATVDSASDDGQPYPTPKVTPHPCPTEGN